MGDSGCVTRTRGGCTVGDSGCVTRTIGGTVNTQWVTVGESPREWWATRTMGETVATR